MKKIMIIAAVIGAALATQAASFKWSTKTGQNVYLPGTTSSAAMSAYLFDSAAVSQANMLSYFDANGAIDVSKALSSATTSSAGKISATDATWGTAGQTLNAYFAVVTSIDDKNYLFISDIASAVGPETGAGLLQFSAKTASQASANEFTPGAAAFGGSGWYTAAVPEPTSGLLMLLGMAGLALRRRRA